MPKVVKLERVTFGGDAELLRRVADWIDQTVRVGTDEAEQLRAVASTLVNLQLADDYRVRHERVQ